MPSPLCHFELVTDDAERARAFYGGVFDWSFDDQSMPGYTLVSPGAEPDGGLMQRPPDAPGRPGLNVYFQVDDLDATLAKAIEFGAKVLVPNTKIPGVGHMAIISDPDGIAVGLLKPQAD